MSMRSVVCHARTYPIRGIFRISRGAKTQSDAVVVEITQNDATGRGECIPYAHYGESVTSVLEQIRAAEQAICDGIDLTGLQRLLPPGAARNAVDCALWDLRCKLTGVSAAEFAGLAQPLRPLVTAFTLSLDTPERMAAQASAHRDKPILKIKLGGEGDVDRVEAVRAAAPGARLSADANESWTAADLQMLPELARLGVELLEQPLRASEDDALIGFRSPVPLAADESCRDRRSVASLRGKYAFANIKLDKTGGLTEALATAHEARDAGLQVMVGCMVASSLSMAPGLVVAQDADFVHLDGPMLLAADWSPSLPMHAGTIFPDAAVWSV
jgi:L-alanine-DL-glutamate epimerase-like enolase superfamily enzyme